MPAPLDLDAIAFTERAVARNLRDFVEAVQRVDPGVGAAWTRCGDGTATYMGEGSPLTTVKGLRHVGEVELDEAEAFFRSLGSSASTIELAPDAAAQAIGLLQRRGYEVVDREDVVVRRGPIHAEEPDLEVVLVDQARWTELQIRANGEPATVEWQALVEASGALPDVQRFGIADDDGWIACAQLAPAAGVGIFGNDATHPSAWRRGAQTALIQARLGAAAALGLTDLMAEVAPGSTSERNYLRCGFEVLATRTHHRLALS